MSQSQPKNIINKEDRAKHDIVAPFSREITGLLEKYEIKDVKEANFILVYYGCSINNHGLPPFETGPRGYTLEFQAGERFQNFYNWPVRSFGLEDDVKAEVMKQFAIWDLWDGIYLPTRKCTIGRKLDVLRNDSSSLAATDGEAVSNAKYIADGGKPLYEEA